MPNSYEDRYTFLEKISVGYDSVVDIIDTLDDMYFDALHNEKKYPPYNIRKTAPGRYLIELSVAGYKRKDVSASLEGELLTVKVANSALADDPEGDDHFYHKGISPSDDVYMKFLVAKHLVLEEVDFKSGILFFYFKDDAGKRDVENIDIGPFAKVARRRRRNYYKTDSVDKKPEVIVPENAETVEVILHKEEDLADSEVILPKEVPQVVEVTVELPESVDYESEEPQVVIEVSDATYEVSDNVDLEVIETDEGHPDIIVAVEKELNKSLEDLGIDVVEEVAEAIEVAVSEDAVSIVLLPDAPEGEEVTSVVEVTVDEEVVALEVPEKVPSVVEAVVEDEKVKLVDASTNISPEAELVPVITPGEENSDIIVVVSEDTKELIGEEDLSERLEAALSDTNVEVEVAKEVEDSSKEVESEDDRFQEETVVIKHADDPNLPTVEIVLPKDGVVSEILETTVTVADEVDYESEEPQITIVVNDASEAIQSEEHTLTVIKTDEDHKDVVVVSELQETELLEDLEIDIAAEVEAALEETQAEPPTLTEEEAETVEVLVEDDDEEGLVKVVLPNEIDHLVEVSLVKNEDELPTLEVKEVTGETATEDAELIVVETPVGEDDIVVAVDHETIVEMAVEGVDIGESISKAIADANVHVRRKFQKPPST